MTVFTVTISQGEYEERTERTLIFSSIEKVQEWKESYKTSYDSFYYRGKEWAHIAEIEVDTNKIINRESSFYIEVEKAPIQFLYDLDKDLFDNLDKLKDELS